MIYKDIIISMTVVRARNLHQLMLFQHRLRQRRNPHIRCWYIAEEIKLTSPFIQVDPLSLLFPVGSFCVLR